MGKVYALLIGIDKYPEGTRSLEGCVADVANVEDYLTGHFTDPAILKLTDSEATYANVIAQIRQHLGQAGKDDVAYLHYSGHGARSQAAPEFAQFDRDGRDEGLVCHDSRLGDNFDLADKELALLIAELAKNEPHIAWVLDCCHSGTGTRDIGGARLVGVRGTGEGNFPRKIESYLEGQYASKQRSADGAPLIPLSRHMLMAACDKDELAKEDLTRSCGIFTRSLYDVLRETNGDLSYAELFSRARVRVAEYVRTVDEGPQRPQFEAIAGFDGWQGFLGRARKIGRRSYMVGKVGDSWSMDGGAIAGLPLSPATPITLALSAESSPDTVAGSAAVTRVGATRSDVVPGFAADPATRYLGVVTSMPDPPLRLRFAGAAAARDAVAKALRDDGGLIAELADEGSDDDGFLLSAVGGKLVLSRRDDGAAVYSVSMDDPAHWIPALLAALAHVAQWRRLLALHNPRPQLDPAKVELSYAQKLSTGAERVHQAPAITIPVERKPDGNWASAEGELQLVNGTGHPLNFALLHFGDDYSVSVLAHDQAAASNQPMTFALDKGDGTADPQVFFFLNDGAEAIEQLKLVLTTEPIDSFLLALDPLSGDRGMGGKAAMEAATKAIDDDWFTIPLTVRVTPQLAQVGTAPVSLADGQITVAPHAAVTANLALVNTLGGARGTGAEDQFAQALARAGIHPAALAGGRGDAVAALDVTDISDPAKLAEAPLQVRLDLKLAAGEVLMPMVRDGAYLMPAGDFWQDPDGATQVSIAHVPAPLVDQRSLGGALRMYFFKSIGIEPGAPLRLASFDEAGQARYSTDGMIGAVKAASRVLVVIHGIIGDTKGMLEGLHACGIDQGFDCILAYDYENLSTPIDATARALKAHLAAVGIGADDGRTVTVLAHSMGGLVARWLTEKEGGSAFIDHLVMCGTPNAGSPFGEVGKARKVLLAMLALGANFGVTLPICGSIAGALSASAKLTATLEQMAPGSEFIAALNGSAAPPTRYTILAGNIDDYQAPDQAFFDALMVKVTRSAPLDLLFDSAANDIAVKTHSILLDDVLGEHPATRTNVACHHLNYFSCPAGQAALRAVVWA